MHPIMHPRRSSICSLRKLFHIDFSGAGRKVNAAEKIRESWSMEASNSE
jgi:hypothetical protein